MGKRIVVEDRSAYFNLPWMVARDEGLLDKEGLDIAFVAPADGRDQSQQPSTNHEEVDSFQGHIIFEEGTIDLFNACEWGQIRRSHDSQTGGAIVAKRPSVAVMGLYSAPGSEILVPQDLRNTKVAVAFHNGSHYAALQMLEGFMERDEINLVHFDQSSPPEDGGPVVFRRYEALMNGEVAAAALMEPWSSLAEKNGCNRIIETFFYGSDIGSQKLDAETYEAINRAVKEAVRRINADKTKYLHYLIEEVPPELGSLTSEDFTLSRIRYIDPEPYSKEEFDKTYEWMLSWGLVDSDTPFEELVDNRISVD